MRDIDKLIDEALDVEESALLRSIGDEPGFFQQTFAIFGGRTGWVNAILMVVQGALFVVGAWAAWQFFAADDVLAALRWGLPASVLVLAALTIKLSMWPAIQTNRLMLELKRIELQMARAGRNL